MNQLFQFFSKKFKTDITSKSEIEKILSNYVNLNIAIRHSDTFLKDESQYKHDWVIKLLEKHGMVKQTGKIKKI